jgi:hypothetical protein
MAIPNGDLGMAGAASATAASGNEAGHCEVVTVSGTQCLQVDFGLVAASAALAVDRHDQSTANIHRSTRLARGRILAIEAEGGAMN